MGRGRKRTPGKRRKDGRLAQPRLVKGSDRAQDRQAKYGNDGYDAIGRAARAGLLGSEANELRDLARAISRTYWRHMPGAVYTCPLDDSPRGRANAEPDHERDRRQEEWLDRCLEVAKPYRPHFDQLAIDPYPDHGPAWLDRLIEARPTDRASSDLAKLAAALRGLEQCGTFRESMLDKAA